MVTTRSGSWQSMLARSESSIDSRWFGPGRHSHDSVAVFGSCQPAWLSSHEVSSVVNRSPFGSAIGIPAAGMNAVLVSVRTQFSR